MHGNLLHEFCLPACNLVHHELPMYTFCNDLATLLGLLTLSSHQAGRQASHHPYRLSSVPLSLVKPYRKVGAKLIRRILAVVAGAAVDDVTENGREYDSMQQMAEGSISKYHMLKYLAWHAYLVHVVVAAY